MRSSEDIPFTDYGSVTTCMMLDVGLQDSKQVMLIKEYGEEVSIARSTLGYNIVRGYQCPWVKHLNINVTCPSEQRGIVQVSDLLKDM